MDQPVAIITGAGRGIGRACAAELARLGHRLVLVSRTESQLRETAAMAGGEALVVPGDVTRPEDVGRITGTTLEHFGRIDVLINNAGIAPVATIEQTTPQMWHEVIDTNLSAAFYLCRECWPVFSRQHSGVIVNVSTYGARDPFPGFLAYGAAKAALNIFSLVLAREGAAIGVRVHTVAPAATETSLFRTIRSEAQVPPDKTLSPQDVARVIGQCVGGELRYTSGEVIWLHKGA